MGPCFGSTDRAPGRCRGGAGRGASMGPCFGVHGSRGRAELLLDLRLASMGPCFGGTDRRSKPLKPTTSSPILQWGRALGARIAATRWQEAPGVVGLQWGRALGARIARM